MEMSSIIAILARASPESAELSRFIGPRAGPRCREVGFRLAAAMLMLNPNQLTIGTSAVPADLVDLLLACHDRIRRFSDIAARLPHAPASTARAELAQAALAVHRYFTVALPLHVQDEDLSVRPRLGGEVEAALERMSREHVEIERLLAEGSPLWLALAEHPNRLDALSPSLDRVATCLSAQLTVHLAQEEQIIFPALSRLDHNVQEEIRSEIRARRS